MYIHKVMEACIGIVLWWRCQVSCVTYCCVCSTLRDSVFIPPLILRSRIDLLAKIPARSTRTSLLFRSTNTCY